MIKILKIQNGQRLPFNKKINEDWNKWDDNKQNKYETKNILGNVHYIANNRRFKRSKV